MGHFGFSSGEPEYQFPGGRSPSERWWQSLWFVMLVAILGLWCCPVVAQSVALMLYWTNPAASRRNKQAFSVLMVALVVIWLAIAAGYLASHHKLPTPNR